MTDEHDEQENDIDITGNVEGQNINIGGGTQHIHMSPSQTDKPTAEHNLPIFISYARHDGREIAADLRQKLENLGFTIWQDVVAMEGGEKWWTQIKEAIEGSVIMVLLLTDAALESGVVHDEWIHARTVGTHIMPITQNDAIFSIAPKWIGKVDVFILDEAHPDYDIAWTRFIKQLNIPPERTPRPLRCRI
ncbi:MAG: toll/interleukin-1 receptor domain-containing protein [Anaerolineae bacterium]|nr:toll/interleukin-1 receptor domain-containing protein [Anaerolineae bacterium]